MPNHSARTRNDQHSAGRAPAGQSSNKGGRVFLKEIVVILKIENKHSGMEAGKLVRQCIAIDVFPCLVET